MLNTNPTPPARIETDRLILRPPGPDDAEAISDGISDFEIVSMLARAPWPYGLEDARAFVANAAGQDPASHRPLSIIHRRHGLIGGCGFHPAEGEPFPELGYWVARAHWGQGYATEAAEAALAWARTAWGKRAVCAGHFVENPASGRVLVKAGMLYTGVIARTPCRARGGAMPARRMIWLA
jgi:RimJ/RimL family protein N-acetyltransferase